MEATILDTIGHEIITVMSPVSICMSLVVLLVYTVSSPTSSATAPIRTAATLVYLESPTDTPTQKLEGALLDALVFVVFIAIATFALVLLYYYNFTNFLKYYMRFSAFVVLGAMGGSVFLSVINRFSIAVDAVTCFVLLFNFTVVGVLSVSVEAVPIVVRQGYMVSLGIIVAAWFTRLPEWTTWALLVALALYDLVAVLAPGGPLKILVELASSRDDELPALVYEARPVVVNRRGGSSLGLLVCGVSDSGLGAVEMQTVSRGGNEMDEIEISGNDEEMERLPLVANARGRMESSGSGPSSEHSTVINVNTDLLDTNRQSEIIADGRGNQLGAMLDRESERERTRSDVRVPDIPESIATMSGGVKLGLGDFVFYSVLVGRAAMYDLMTVYACYLAIISGLGCTLILLAVFRKALPALPISIALGTLFYFLTRLLMEPFVVGISTSLLMF